MLGEIFSLRETTTSISYNSIRNTNGCTKKEIQIFKE